MDTNESVDDPFDILDEETAQIIARAIGDELRRVREARGWSRTQFVARLPSRVGDRTLLAYEHGLRQLKVLRLLELCQGAEVGAPDVLGRALQRAQITLASLTLRVDLRKLVVHGNHKFRPMVQWARNKLNKCPDGVAELTPSAVVELADFMGCGRDELAAHLARFLPEDTSERGQW